MEGSQSFLSEECCSTLPSYVRVRRLYECKGSRNIYQIIHAFLVVSSFLHIHSNYKRTRKENGFFFCTFNRQNELAKERWGTKDLKLYPVSTVLHVSQCPGPVIHSSFPYLSLLRMKDKQKPNSSWLAWCFLIKALLLSRPSLHPVPTSLQPWPYIIFQTQCFSSSSLFSSSLFSPTSPRIKHS